MAKKPLRVLIADDHEDLAETLSTFIESTCECEVTTTVNGALALALAIKLEPDAVILDIDMPVMNGLQAAHALRTELGFKPPLLIALSAGTQLDLVRQAAVFDHVLAKPDDIVILPTLLRNLEDDAGGSLRDASHSIAAVDGGPDRSPRLAQVRSEPSCLAGGGQMGALLRRHDWAASGLGNPGTWPQGLRSAIRLMLQTGHPMYIFWGDERLCFYNDAYALSLGSDRHPGSLGRPGSEVWTEIWGQIGPQIDRVMQGGGATWHENQLVPMNRNGVREDSYWTYSFGPIDDEAAAHGIGGVLTVCTETTANVALARKLATSQERLNEALQAGGGIGTWDWDVVNDLVVADERFARLYGADPLKAGIGAPLIDFFAAIHPDDALDLRACIDATLAGQERLWAEYRLVGLDGTHRWVLAEGRCEYDAAGRPVRLAGISMDITDRRQASEQLRIHKQNLEVVVAERTIALSTAVSSLENAARLNHALTDAIPGQVVYWTNKHICTFVNRAFADWLGTTPDKLLGASASDLHQYERFDWNRPEVEAAFRGERQTLIRESTGEPGRTITHKVQYVPDFASDGEVLGIYVVAFDVTELKGAEAGLRLANHALAFSRDEARQADRAKSAFLANMSHEIRTPMNAIIGLTYLLSRSRLDQPQRERLAQVSDAAGHLLGLIDSILDLSKIEAGKLELDIHEFGTAEMIDSIVAMVSGPARDKGLRLSVDCGGLPEHMRGDKLRLSQILINLLANAVKFTDVGSVELRARVIDRRHSRIHLSFEVADTGCGIALDQQSRLFKPFEQADVSLKRKHGGTGLGLALSRRLATAMGGEVTLSSAPDVGSTFRFSTWLDAVAEPDATFEAVSASIVAAEERVRALHAGRQVLLVEDNAVNRVVAEELLSAAGLSVTSVRNGAEAVAAIETASFDLVFMDMQMPVMDGLEAARTFRQRGRSMPIVAMTANAYPRDKQLCLDAGMNDHVAKPFKPEALYDSILQWLA